MGGGGQTGVLDGDGAVEIKDNGLRRRTTPMLNLLDNQARQTAGGRGESGERRKEGEERK
eukprot:3118039-Rhodomonas_salina.1